MVVMAFVASILQDKHEKENARKVKGLLSQKSGLRKSSQEKGRTKYTSTYCKPNYVLVFIDQFLEKNLDCIPEDVREELKQHTLNDRCYIYLEKNIQKSIESNRQKRNEENILLARTASLNSRGIALEKAGKIEDAISVYEENIALGYKAHHAYKRLMVLYRKSKDKKNEIRVIRRALEVFGEYPEYVERLRNISLLTAPSKRCSTGELRQGFKQEKRLSNLKKQER